MLSPVIRNGMQLYKTNLTANSPHRKKAPNQQKKDVVKPVTIKPRFRSAEDLSSTKPMSKNVFLNKSVNRLEQISEADENEGNASDTLNSKKSRELAIQLGECMSNSKKEMHNKNAFKRFTDLIVRIFFRIKNRGNNSTKKSRKSSQTTTTCTNSQKSYLTGCRSNVGLCL
uniref:Uncharacterized protein n=1 Tax=Rhabditophanes sp. KR3021 TaxID=114890 RepID=A0AC35U899_9BILA